MLDYSENNICVYFQKVYNYIQHSCRKVVHFSELNPHRGRRLWTDGAGMIPSRESNLGGGTSTKSGCSKKKKKNVSSDPCEVVTEWEERRAGQEDRWQKGRQKILSCTQLHSFSSTGRRGKKSQFLISQRSSGGDRGGRKKELCGAPDDRGRTGTHVNPCCRQDTEVSSHLCLFHFLPFQGESHYSSLASRGHLTINRDKHWWPLTYPWQWPSAEQNQTLALSSKPSWEWRGAPCAGQMASGEGDHGAQWSLADEIPLRKLGLVFVLTEVHQECRSFISSRTFKRPNDSKTHFTNKYTVMCL